VCHLRIQNAVVSGKSSHGRFAVFNSTLSHVDLVRNISLDFPVFKNR
jgi:hypothetical protein